MGSVFRWFRVLVAFSLVAITHPTAADTEVVIKEWDVPTPNSRPHDPAVSPDGSLWYTGQLSNRLGRLDAKSGQIREYPLKTPGSGPHGLVADKAGKIWYTGNSAAHIGKLNPENGEVTEYPMPDTRARDPHTPVFDSRGILWFTVQMGNFVGKLEPDTGTVTLRESPTPNSRPYGIVVNSEGIPFFCENNSNKIGSIHPDTLEITEYLLPANARPRRLTVTPDDVIYYTSDRGYLGRLDPRIRAVEEWLSPGGPASAPYGIAATQDGVIWYCETGVQPNTLVRFDPVSKTFETWRIPSGGGVVRHMVATPEQNLYIACSGVNKVGIVYLPNQRTFSIPDRGGLSWTTPGGSGSPVIGYARIEAGAGSTTPFGFAVFSLRQKGVLVSEASVSASPLIRSSRVYAEMNGSVRTGLAIANPNDQAATVSFYFTDGDGRDSGHGMATIPSNGQIARFLDEAPFGENTSFRGTFTFTSLTPVSVAALRGLSNEQSEFLITTLPLVELSAPPAENLIFPHFADGGGWVTQTVLVNPSDQSMHGTVQFFSPGSEKEPGQPISLAVDGQEGTSFAYAIAPRSAKRLRTSGAAGPLRVGTVRVTPASTTRTPSGLLILSFQRGGVTVSEAGLPAVRAGSVFRLYAEASGSFDAGQAGSLLTGIAIANPSPSIAIADLELTTLTGAATGLTGTAVIPAQGQIALFLNQVQGLASLPFPFQGILRISTASSEGIFVTGLRGRHNEKGDFLITTTPPVNEGELPSNAENVFPHLVESGGYTTQLVLFSSAAGQSSSGVLRFFSQNGLPLSLSLR